MLRITPCLLSLSVFLCSAFGAPGYDPSREPHTGGDWSPTTTSTDDANTYTDGSPTTATIPTTTSTNTGGEFFEQTTMPVCYRLASEFPASSQWVSLQTLIDTSRPDMIGSSNDGPDEADAAIAAVQSVSESAGLDARIAFAIMMQESAGKVRPIVGDHGKSFGLFQAQIPGIPLCDNYTKNECPTDVITSQVEFGIFGHDGTGSPVAPGFAYWMGAQGGNVGRSLRGYNTGSVPNPNDLTQAGVATPSYVSDVANRLTGALLGAKHQTTCS
ncbi:MAG: hypothetical protein Q9166_000864 [cf. Caloplaca sp. 2 TL-2023]